MPYKNYQNKLRYNSLHNPNRVTSFLNGNKIIQTNLNGIINRNYVCSFCGECGKTSFHHPIPDKKNKTFVIQLCSFCHDLIHNNKFDENKLFGE